MNQGSSVSLGVIDIVSNRMNLIKMQIPAMLGTYSAVILNLLGGLLECTSSYNIWRLVSVELKELLSNIYCVEEEVNEEK